MQVATMVHELLMAFPAAWQFCAAAWDSFAQAAGSTLATSIWQGAVVVCGLEICLLVMPRISAAHRFAIWVAGFSVTFALPLLPSFHLGNARALVAGTGSGEPLPGALLQLDARWGIAIAGLWVVASFVRGTDLLVHSVRLWRLWKTAQPVEVAESISNSLAGLRGGRIRICKTEMLDRPSVIGFLSPRVLIPAWLLERMTPGELEQIVLHEAEHLRRRDDWTNLVQKLCLVVFPLNPALAWMEHKLCREREMACDEGVVRITNAPRAYAACLTSLAERGLERRAEALSLGAWHRRSELAHRVHGLLLRKPRLGRAAAGTVLGVVGCALLAGSVEMARCPQLVAFIPKQNDLAMTPERQQQLAALLERENTEAKAGLPAGFRAIPAKAVIPAAHRTTHRRTARQEAVPASTAVAPTDATEQTAKADVAGDRVNMAAGQQWVILAAWEEVRTVSHSPGTIADYDTGAARNVGKIGTPGETGSSAPMTPGQAGNSYTVTQLILRVVPANSNSGSGQAPTASLHGGWFVIQL